MRNILSQLDLQRTNVLAGNQSTDQHGQQDLKILLKNNPKTTVILLNSVFIDMISRPTPPHPSLLVPVGSHLPYLNPSFVI